jgi:hypothetical protein
MDDYIKDIVVSSKKLKEYLEDIGNVKPVATIEHPTNPKWNAWVFRPTARVRRLMEAYSKDGDTDA